MLIELLNLIFSKLFFFALHQEKQNCFPKPLSANEEQECFKKLSCGDQDARNKLIEHNLRLVAHIVKKYAGSTCDAEDLLSIGTIGLIKAVSTFSYEKGSKFATYASRCIDNEILMYLRSLKKTNSELYINDPIETDKDGNPLTLLDLIADDQNVADLIDLKLKSEELYKYIKESLSVRERHIISLRYGLYGKKALTQREIAKLLHISRSYVSRIEKKALEKLREKFLG